MDLRVFHLARMRSYAGTRSQSPVYSSRHERHVRITLSLGEQAPDKYMSRPEWVDAQLASDELVCLQIKTLEIAGDEIADRL
jgi:hypothetical protein